MEPIKIYLEIGKRKTFAVAPDWPGWARWGKGEEDALQSLLDYAPQYAAVLQPAGVSFTAPVSVDAFAIVERLSGNATTDFGAPSVSPRSDDRPVAPDELERMQTILKACWVAFDKTVEGAAGVELRKGPRGGGRDLRGIQQHVLEADRSYLPRMVWKYRWDKNLTVEEQTQNLRQAVLEALTNAVENGLPEKGPRGGSVWPPRYFARRVAWHTLDHAWEIENRKKGA